MKVNSSLQLTNRIFARNEGCRIAYYHIDSPTGADLWDGHWEDNIRVDLKNFYHPYLSGFLGYGQLRRIFLRHLPRKGLILDGGCGMGQYVVALRSRGYDCFGVDFAPKTVEKVKDYLPDLPVESGDICNLHLKDKSIDAYISLGIVEHFQDGPYRALKEAMRVLKDNGVLIVSVPQAFHWRRLNAYPGDTPLPDDAFFYQYAFSSEEFRTILINSGFQVDVEYGRSSHYAFKLRFKTFRKLLSWFPRLAHIDLVFDRTPIGCNLARTRLYVARKIYET
jgi:SAM-dependent methyltransferase